MSVFSALTTERLILRKLDARDREALFAYRSMPDVCKFQGFAPKDLDDIDQFIKGIADSPNTPDTWFQLAICTREDNRMIGDIGLHFLQDISQVEIGYTLSPDFQGCGYALEAVRAVVTYLFCNLRKCEIVASVDPRNDKSIRLLEKLGFRSEEQMSQDGPVQNQPFDECIYRLR